MPLHYPILMRVSVDELAQGFQLPTGLYNLNNPVHPFVARNKFPPDFYYDAFIPVFRALSLIIDTHIMKKYIIALFFSQHQEIPDPKAPNGRFFRMRLKTDKLTLEEQKMAEDCLTYLAEVFTGFEIVDFPPHVQARTRMTDLIFTASKGKHPPAPMPGKTSLICLCESVCNSIILRYTSERSVSHKADALQKFSLQLLREYASLLSSILHEFAHFCQSARRELLLDPERMLGDNSMCEAGLDLCVLILGGDLHLHDEDDLSPLGCYLLEWPDETLKAKYLHHSPNICIDSTQPPKEQSSVLWAIADTWILQLFLRDAWTKRMDSDSPFFESKHKVLGRQTEAPVCLCRTHPGENLLWADTREPVNYSIPTNSTRSAVVVLHNPMCPLESGLKMPATLASVPLEYVRHTDGTLVREEFRTKLAQMVAQQERELAEHERWEQAEKERQARTESNDCTTQ